MPLQAVTAAAAAYKALKAEVAEAEERVAEAKFQKDQAEANGMAPHRALAAPMLK